MRKIEIKDYIFAFGMAMVLSLGLSLLFMVSFAQFFSDLIIGQYPNDVVLGALIIVYFFLFIILSMFSAYIFTPYFPSVLLKSTLVAFVGLFVFILPLAYFSLFFSYPYIFRALEPWEMPLVWPKVVIDFSLYFCPHPVYFFIFSSLIYNLLFILFLYYFGEAK